MRDETPKIDQLLQAFRSGGEAELLELLDRFGISSSYVLLGQNLLWSKDLEGFRRLVALGPKLNSGELEVLNLGLQLVPPHLPDSSWAFPPLCDLIEPAYQCIEEALKVYPEPLSLFRRLALDRQRAAREQANDQGRGPTGWG